MLAAEGISCDVLDLRTLVPLDRDAILASVRKTGRLVVAAEAVKRGSVASDIAAFAAESAFPFLKAPILRVCGKVTPIPYHTVLEQAVIPDAGEIADAVRKLVRG
jgi:pyruvate dehydrogenase E1 component beta subunit